MKREFLHTKSSWSTGMIVATVSLVLVWTFPASALSLPANAETATGPVVSVSSLVEAHRAIAEIEHNWLNWPEENPDLKPLFEEFIPEEYVIRRAEEPLRMSVALEELYGVPVTSDQLQAELDRQAVSTKKPDRLREMWAALGNDPELIAEVVARPILAENRLREMYYADNQLHGDQENAILKELASLADPGNLNTLSGSWEETEYRLSEPSSDDFDPSADRARGTVRIATDDWPRFLQELAGRFGKAGLNDETELDKAIGRLDEQQELISVTAVIAARPGVVRLGTMMWRKPSFGDWWESVRHDFPVRIMGQSSSFHFTLPLINREMSRQAELWEATTTTGAPVGRHSFACVWSGTEMIVWGGGIDSYVQNSGGRYNPTTDSWISTSTTSAPSARQAGQAVWTGTEMIVWGNTGDPADKTGGRYNPVLDSWTSTSTGSNCPTGRSLFSMVWTGTTAIVWGGDDGGAYPVDTGGRYNPTTDTWTVVGTVGAPSPRAEHHATWNSSDLMIIWGGRFWPAQYLDTGARHNGGSTWISATPTSGAPEPRWGSTMVHRLNGGVQAVWGGMLASSPYNSLNTGSRLDISTGTWTPIPTTDAPAGRRDHSAIWSHNVQEMIVWGGYTDVSPYLTNTGGRYRLSTNAWTPMTTTGAPSARKWPRAIDIANAGVNMIVWGGQTFSSIYPTDGGVYFVCSDNGPVLPTSPVSVTDLHTCTRGLRISWLDASQWNDEGYGTRSYEIYRDGALLASRDYGTNSWDDLTTVPGTSHSYVVRYINGCEHDKNSGAVSQSDTVTGSAPGGLTNNTAVDYDGCESNGVTVTWPRNPANWNDSVDRVNLRQYTILVDGVSEASIPYSDNVTSYRIYPPAGVSCTVSVRYENGCQFSADTSGVIVSDLIPGQPVVPVIGAADVSACANSGVTVTWTAPGNWGDNGSGTRTCDVIRDSVTIQSSIPESTTSLTDTTGVNGTSYSYQVLFRNGCDLTATSTGVSAADLVSVQPSGLSVGPFADDDPCDYTGIRLEWAVDPTDWGDFGLNPSARYYRVFRGVKDEDCTVSALSEQIPYGSQTMYMDTTGDPEGTYCYAIRYINSCGNQRFSSGYYRTDRADTAPCPDVGDTLTIAKSDTDAALNWTAVSCADLTHYQVFGAMSFGAAFPGDWTLLATPAGTTTTDPLASSFVAYLIVNEDACGNISID